MFSQLNIEKKRRKDSFSLGHTDSSHITEILKKKNVRIHDKYMWLCCTSPHQKYTFYTIWFWKKFKSWIFLDQVIPKIEDSLYTKLNSSTDIRALCHIECVGLGTLRAAGKVCPRHLLGPGRFDLIHFPAFSQFIL